MTPFSALIEFLASFGLSVKDLVYYGKFVPVAALAAAFMGFFYSNTRRMEEEKRERIVKKLRSAGATGERGLSAAEIAMRLAPSREEQGARRFIVRLAEAALKLAKFDRKATEEKLFFSGDRDPRAISRYILQRGAGMIIAPIIGWFVLPALGFTGILQVMGALTCVLAGGIVVDVRLDKALKQRRERMMAELPVLLDLLTIYLEAGQAFDVALSKASVALRLSFPTAAEEMGFLRHDLEMSVSRQKTLQEFARRVNSPTARNFVAIVIQSELRGNAVAPSLRTLARESRKEFISEIERKAQKLPTLINGPMFLFILPSIFLSVLGPAVVQILKEFVL